ncbi:hypothetical protein [Microcoleus sp. FACHB-672]|uniref:hypothetical protein n=1 Tax=Microcoleus sp. FACHB-672 TaxID=2692825 RepID=UPI001688456C|nr:hypothetical protein [Microcoleus sp. FACHB-672]MBD2042299.1 hypothetical protein [Microcoleus sp. FACHB-672]
MQPKIIWQMGSSNPDNTNNLDTIRQWWSTLAGKEISWRQRLIPPSGDVSELDWEPQRFDELFVVSSPQIRGITLYWRKPNSQDERSTTPHKLELDTRRQQFYIYPQSQKNLVIQVGFPEIVYQKIELKNPEIEYRQSDEKGIITLRDIQQQLEIKVALSPEKIAQLKQLFQS